MGIWKPQRGSPIIKGHPLARGLVGCWLFNEGSGGTLYDISGYDNHMVNSGAVWAASANGWALNFDAFADYAEAADSPSLDVTSFTLYARFMLTGSEVGDTGLIYKWGVGGNASYTMGLTVSAGYNPTVLRIGLHNGAVTKWPSGTINLFDPRNVWHDYVGTFDGTTLKGYVDSVLDINTADTVVPMNSTVNPRLGYGDDNCTGLMPLAMIWNRALSQNEVAWLSADPYAFIDQGEMDWLRMLGAVEEIMVPIHLLIDNRVLGGI